ncbi:MAG: 50S ribosomal protein L13 [Leptospiraceae bacterium]|nr:50S ribosomal protein L13 [Leptospiraceae bacterium]MCP5500713.1 50S ribosomal protein L13 [Leptospiraceae bacterium]
MTTVAPIHKTPVLKKEEIEKNWYVVDAEGKTLGRLCAFVASRLRGKHKPAFTPNQDCGDNIIVINADKVKVTGNKAAQKKYHRHSNYPGGLTTQTFTELKAKDPRKIIEIGVKGMLPKNRLGSQMMTNIRIFSGSNHNMQAQKPVELDF